jgi:hypothetical protein
MTTTLKATITTAALLIGTTLAFISHAQTPLSLNDIVQAERARMEASHPHTVNAVSPSMEKDEQWLLNTPGTWSYLINAEKLRMKQNQPAADPQSTPSQHTQNTTVIPTTLNERIQIEHTKMGNR